MDAAGQAAAAALRTPPEIAFDLLGVGLAVGLWAVLRSLDEHPVTLVADAVGLAALDDRRHRCDRRGGVGARRRRSRDGRRRRRRPCRRRGLVGGEKRVRRRLRRYPSRPRAVHPHDDFYASGAVLGGTAFLLVDLAGATERAAVVVCAVITFIMRLPAITRDRELPTVQGLGLTEQKRPRLSRRRSASPTERPYLVTREPAGRPTSGGNSNGADRSRSEAERAERGRASGAREASRRRSEERRVGKEC